MDTPMPRFCNCAHLKCYDCNLSAFCSGYRMTISLSSWSRVNLGPVDIEMNQSNNAVIIRSMGMSVELLRLSSRGRSQNPHLSVHPLLIPLPHGCKWPEQRMTGYIRSGSLTETGTLKCFFDEIIMHVEVRSWGDAAMLGSPMLRTL